MHEEALFSLSMQHCNVEKKMQAFSVIKIIIIIIIFLHMFKNY